MAEVEEQLRALLVPCDVPGCGSPSTWYARCRECSNTGLLCDHHQFRIVMKSFSMNTRCAICMKLGAFTAVFEVAKI